MGGAPKRLAPQGFIPGHRLAVAADKRVPGQPAGGRVGIVAGQAGPVARGAEIRIQALADAQGRADLARHPPTANRAGEFRQQVDLQRAGHGQAQAPDPLRGHLDDGLVRKLGVPALGRRGADLVVETILHLFAERGRPDHSEIQPQHVAPGRRVLDQRQAAQQQPGIGPVRRIGRIHLGPARREQKLRQAQPDPLGPVTPEPAAEFAERVRHAPHRSGPAEMLAGGVVAVGAVQRVVLEAQGQDTVGSGRRRGAGGDAERKHDGDRQQAETTGRTGHGPARTLARSEAPAAGGGVIRRTPAMRRRPIEPGGAGAVSDPGAGSIRRGMGGRAVEGSGLENRQGATPRGFESHPIRHKPAPSGAGDDAPPRRRPPSISGRPVPAPTGWPSPSCGSATARRDWRRGHRAAARCR